jgi:acyl-coenzyme A synthetase/AMP-(fatty) acid ligase
MTESGAITTTQIDDPPDKTFETDGFALTGMEVRVVDDNGTALPTDA